jgi:hypothetical protein
MRVCGQRTHARAQRERERERERERTLTLGLLTGHSRWNVSAASAGRFLPALALALAWARTPVRSRPLRWARCPSFTDERLAELPSLKLRDALRGN